jgi:hypothetical protein
MTTPSDNFDYALWGMFYEVRLPLLRRRLDIATRPDRHNRYFEALTLMVLSRLRWLEAGVTVAAHTITVPQVSLFWNELTQIMPPFPTGQHVRDVLRDLMELVSLLGVEYADNVARCEQVLPCYGFVQKYLLRNSLAWHYYGNQLLREASPSWPIPTALGEPWRRRVTPSAVHPPTPPATPARDNERSLARNSERAPASDGERDKCKRARTRERESGLDTHCEELSESEPQRARNRGGKLETEQKCSCKATCKGKCKKREGESDSSRARNRGDSLEPESVSHSDSHFHDLSLRVPFPSVTRQAGPPVLLLRQLDWEKERRSERRAREAREEQCAHYAQHRLEQARVVAWCEKDEARSERAREATEEEHAEWRAVWRDSAQLRDEEREQRRAWQAYREALHARQQEISRLVGRITAPVSLSPSHYDNEPSDHDSEIPLD